MKYKIIHKTTYWYNEMVSVCHNLAWLIPSNLNYQFCEKYDIVIEPKPQDYLIREDFFGNKVAYFSLQQPHNSLVVTSRSIVRREIDKIIQLPIASGGTTAQAIAFLAQISPQTLEIKQFVLESHFVKYNKEIKDYALKSFLPNRPLLEAAQELTARIYNDFDFVSGFTTISTPIEVVFREKKGVCQDFSHFAIACIRSIGLAARYVSGYIETLPPPGKTKLIGSDASHAWFSIYIPDMGWLDFDPTNNIMPKDKHVTVAYGRDYADVTPLKGVIFSSGQHRLEVSVDMETVYI